MECAELRSAIGSPSGAEPENVLFGLRRNVLEVYLHVAALDELPAKGATLGGSKFGFVQSGNRLKNVLEDVLKGGLRSYRQNMLLVVRLALDQCGGGEGVKIPGIPFCVPGAPPRSNRPVRPGVSMPWALHRSRRATLRVS